MATFTITPPHPFPVGTSVDVYLARAIAGKASPGGTVVTSAVVDANSVLSFSNLVAGTYYVAFANGTAVFFSANAPSDELELDATDPQQLASRIDVHAPTGIALNADGNLDGQNGANPNPYRIGFGIGTVNGSNGVRGDSVTSDTANGSGASFFSPYYQNVGAWADRGSMTQYAAYGDIDEVGAGGVYGELFGYYAGITTNRVGALSGGAEFQNHVISGKPARASALNLVVTEDNAGAAYNAATFGAGSQWLRGARVLDLISNGAQAVGVGINFRGSFTWPIHADFGGGSRFGVGSVGFVDVSRGAASSNALRVFIHNGGGPAGTDDPLNPTNPTFFLRADGLLAWADPAASPTPVQDVTIARTGAATLTLTGKLGVSSNVGFNGTAPVAKPTVSGSRSANAALASLLTALASYGLVTDSSTA